MEKSYDSQKNRTSFFPEKQITFELQLKEVVVMAVVGVVFVVGLVVVVVVIVGHRNLTLKFGQNRANNN